MTIAPKSIALAAALLAQSLFVGPSPAAALPFDFPDVSFPDAETRQGCHFSGTCERAQVVAKQENVSHLAPLNFPQASGKHDR